MDFFQSEGHRIAFERFGDGPLVVLIHGFASNGRVNWVDTGWVETLTEVGYGVATLDNRGHGSSDKLYDPADYAPPEMARDALNLVAHLNAGRAALVGYSMGARIAAFAALAAPDRIAAAVFGGLGMNMVEGMSDSEEIAVALEAPSLEDVPKGVGRGYRLFAERTGSDLLALAACMRGNRRKARREDLEQLEVPVLVAVGGEDQVSGAAEPLAALMPKGEALVIEGRDHMKATGDKAFKAGVLGFFGRHYPPPA